MLGSAFYKTMTIVSLVVKVSTRLFSLLRYIW